MSRNDVGSGAVMRRFRILAMPAIVAAGLLTVAPTATASAAGTAPSRAVVAGTAVGTSAGCATPSAFMRIVGQGDLCQSGKAWWLRLRNGRQLSIAPPDLTSTLLPAGTAAAPSTRAASAPLSAAQCANPATHQHIEIYYAHFAGAADNIATMTADIQQQFRDVDSSYMNYDGMHYFGTGVNLYVECDALLNPVVHDIALSTPLGASDYSSIASDMQAQGHTNPLAHYWIWTDGNPEAALGYAGQSSVESDDSAGVNNLVNQNYEYSVNYGYTESASGAQIFAHENGHAMGAVQLSAAHSTGGYHCTDGYDVMCYNDGGPAGSAYNTTTCGLAPNGTAIFDCNFDDYFNPAPAPGSYLATHWNIASRNNAWVLITPATPTAALSAAPGSVTAGLPVTLTATVAATAPAPGVATGTVTFSDGATSLGTVTLDARGTAALTTGALGAGTHTFGARYSGSTVYAAATAPSVAVTASTGGSGGGGSGGSGGSSLATITDLPPAAAATGVHFASLDSLGHGGAAIAVTDGHTYAMPSNGSSFGPLTTLAGAFHGSIGTYFADLDGPGKPASEIAVNPSSVYVMKNTNGSFGAAQLWSTSLFYGSIATVAADVDGSGRASLVAINSNSIWVMLNTGSGFASPRMWSSTAFYGSRSTVMAVMDASGRAEPVAVNDGSIWVMHNNGAGFDAPTAWSAAPFYGSRGTYIVDVDGGGLAEAVAVNDTSIWVMHNTGAGFSGPRLWASGAFYGTWNYLADIDGSGRASVLAVTAGSIWVRKNLGSSFGPPTNWSSASFYGDH